MSLATKITMDILRGIVHATEWAIVLLVLALLAWSLAETIKKE